MADDADRAAEMMEREEAARRKYADTGKVNGHGPANCQTCGDTMPEARRAHGFHECMTCVELEEAAHRLRRQ